METAIDEYRLEEIARDHSIDAAVFVPFTIMRLRVDGGAIEATLDVRLRDVGDSGERQKTLRLTWSPTSVPAQPPAVQDRTVTEWAACGLACVLVSLYARLHVRGVAADGDRFDYWVSNGERDYALEVSGTTTDDVEARHRIKLRQLRENPTASMGTWSSSDSRRAASYSPSTDLRRNPDEPTTVARHQPARSGCGV